MSYLDKFIPLVFKISFVLCLLFLFTITSASAQDIGNLQNQKPVSIGGAFQATSIVYSAHGIEQRNDPFNYLLNGDVSINIYGLVIPLSFSYTKSQTSFVQPFNQFGVSPTYKWITLHLGYQNITYSPYSLAGHTINGVGADLRPGKLRLGFMYGRLNKATTLDTLSGALVPFSFSRTAYAGRLGYGTDANYFELNYMKARDDSSSVNRKDIPSADYVAPAGNTVVGYDTKFVFFKHLFFESAGGLSIYTRDLNSSISLDDLHNKLYNFAQKFADINGTSQYYTAFNASAGYRAPMYGIKVVYRRIDPEYQSMGAYYFDSDLESWAVSPNFTLFKNRLRITGNVGVQHDNLNKQKRSTNKRVISSGTASLQFTKALALDGNYSNFSNNQQPNTVRYPDSLRIVQTTSNLTLTPRYTIISPDLVHAISFTWSLNKLNDLNKIITNSSTISRTVSTKQYFATYALTFVKKSMGLVFNVNKTDLTSQDQNYTYQGGTVGAFASFFKSKLQLNVNTSLMQGVTKAGKSLINNDTGTFTYKVSRNHSLKWASFFTSNHPEPGSSQKKYTEYRNEFSYALNF